MIPEFVSDFWYEGEVLIYDKKEWDFEIDAKCLISKYTFLESITENALDYYRSLAACIVVNLSLISNDTSADGEIPCF